MAVKNTMTTNTIYCATALAHTKLPAVLPTISFAPLEQMQNEKDK